jgi:hypothetical protein
MSGGRLLCATARKPFLPLALPGKRRSAWGLAGDRRKRGSCERGQRRIMPSAQAAHEISATGARLLQGEGGDYKDLYRDGSVNMRALVGKYA